MTPGRFPLVPLLVVAPLLLGLLWCFYDAYWPRPLALEAIYQVGGNDEILDRTDPRLAEHLPNPAPDRAVLITINNGSLFFVKRARIVFVTKDKKGEILSIEESPCLHLGEAELNVPPKISARDANPVCVAGLDGKSQRSLESSGFARYEWYFSELKGHRAPVRLIRRPLELVGLMFERIYD